MSTKEASESEGTSPNELEKEEREETGTAAPKTKSRLEKKASAPEITTDYAETADQEPAVKTDRPQQQQLDSPTQEESNPSYLPCSQISVGGEDDQLRMLDRCGDLTNVIGSQSILSQELMDLNPSQREGLFVIHRGEASEEEEVSETTTPTATKIGEDDDEGDDGSQDSASPPPPQVEEIPSSQLSVNGFSQLSFLMDAAQAIEDAEDSQKVVADMLLEENGTSQVEPTMATRRQSRRNKPNEKPEPETAGTTAAVVPDKRPSCNNNPGRIRPTRPPPIPDPETQDMKARVDTLIQKALSEKDSDEQDSASVGSQGTECKTESVVKRFKNGGGKAVTSPITDNKKTTPDGKSDSNSDGLTPFQQRKRQKQQDQKQAHELAQQAADLAAQIIAHPQVAKQLLLTMALRRINPRAAPSTWPPKGTVIADGFFWGTYPPLETVLRANMRSYYDLSTNMCQSKDQQSFNNDLTDLIRQEASRYGWEFDPQVFTDKVLRDRIRCFFKTHIQNSKKRLRTLIKNPTKKANAKALVAHLELIQTYSEAEGDECDEDNFLNGGGATEKKAQTPSQENKAEMAREVAKNYKHLTEEKHAGLPAPRKNEVSRAKRKSAAPPAEPPSSISAKQRTAAHRRRGRPKKRSRAEQEAAESVMAFVASAAAASSRHSGSSAPRRKSASPVANPIGPVEAL